MIVYLYIEIHIYTYTHIHIYTHIHMIVYLYTYTHMIYILNNMCIYTHTDICMQMCIHVYMCVHTSSMAVTRLAMDFSPTEWSPWPSQEFSIHCDSVALSPAERATGTKCMQKVWLGHGLQGLVVKSVA